MPKSNLTLLKEAIAKGDVTKATELADKIAKMDKKGKTAKIKNKARNNPTKASTVKKAATAKTRDDVDVSALSDSEYLAPSKRPGGDDYFGGRKFIGDDGKEHIYAKRVSMEGTKFVNKFNPNDYAKLPERHQKLEKKIKSLKSVPKPGQRGAEREVSKKVQARCSICRNIVEVYPWETETVDGESNFRCSKKSCVRAR